MKTKKSLIDYIKSIGKKKKLKEEEIGKWFEFIMNIIILNKDKEDKI